VHISKIKVFIKKFEGLKDKTKWSKLLLTIQKGIWKINLCLIQELDMSLENL
jgi:hypothetical protein